MRAAREPEARNLNDVTAIAQPQKHTTHNVTF